MGYPGYNVMRPGVYSYTYNTGGITYTYKVNYGRTYWYNPQVRKVCWTDVKYRATGCDAGGIVGIVVGSILGVCCLGIVGCVFCCMCMGAAGAKAVQ